MSIAGTSSQRTGGDPNPLQANVLFRDIFFITTDSAAGSGHYGDTTIDLTGITLDSVNLPKIDIFRDASGAGITSAVIGPYTTVDSSGVLVESLSYSIRADQGLPTPGALSIYVEYYRRPGTLNAVYTFYYLIYSTAIPNQFVDF